MDKVSRIDDHSSRIMLPKAEVFVSSCPSSKNAGGDKEEGKKNGNPSSCSVSNKTRAIKLSNNERRDLIDNNGVGPVVENSYSDVRVKYDVDPAQLGYGLYGVVRTCKNRETKEAFAIKSIRKSKVGKGNLPLLQREVKLLREISHPNIIKLVDVYEDQDDLHLVTELCTGGELFDRIIAKRKKGEVYSEKAAAVIIRSILEAIEYCHDEKQVVHRDLKPENILFETEAENSAIKLIDFGYAKHHMKDQPPMKEVVGSTMYMSPELLDQNYTKKCDIWSIGVVAFALLSGSPPFNAASEDEIIEQIRTGPLRFSSPHWKGVSDHGKDFVRKMLKKDPRKRMTAAIALQHQWMRQFAPEENDDKIVEYSSHVQVHNAGRGPLLVKKCSFHNFNKEARPIITRMIKRMPSMSSKSKRKVVVAMSA